MNTILLILGIMGFMFGAVWVSTFFIGVTIMLIEIIRDRRRK